MIKFKFNIYKIKINKFKSNGFFRHGLFKPLKLLIKIKKFAKVKIRRSYNLVISYTFWIIEKESFHRCNLALEIQEILTITTDFSEKLTKKKLFNCLILHKKNYCLIKACAAFLGAPRFLFWPKGICLAVNGIMQPSRCKVAESAITCLCGCSF